MLGSPTKIADLSRVKSLNSFSSSSSYQAFSKRDQVDLRAKHVCSSASNKGNVKKLSSLFTPQSTPPTSDYRRALGKSLPNATNSGKIDVNQAKPFSNYMIQSDSRSPISSFGHLFGALVKSKHYPEAVQCYKRFASSGLPSNFFTLNMLLDSYCNMKLASVGGFSALGVILKNGYSPNTITLTSLVKGLCLEEKIGEGCELFRKMIRLRCYPNVVTCGTLINGLCKTGNSTAALELHREMVSGKVGIGLSCKPTLVSYGTLIDGLCKAGFLAKARELFLEMKSMGISPNVVVYSSLLDGLCRSGKWEEAKLLYQEMVDNGVSPNVMTFCILKDNLCKQGKSEKAKELMEMMAESGDLPDLVV